MEQFFEPLQQMLPSHQDLTARSMITHRTMTENPIRPLVCPNIIKGGEKGFLGFLFCARQTQSASWKEKHFSHYL